MPIWKKKENPVSLVSRPGGKRYWLRVWVCGRDITEALLLSLTRSWVITSYMSCFCSVVPEISQELIVTSITQTSLTLTWSIGSTWNIDSIQLYQTEDGQGSTSVNTLSNTSHTATSLKPGTNYTFYVEINSYGKTNKTRPRTVTTGASDNAALLRLNHCSRMRF